MKSTEHKIRSRHDDLELSVLVIRPDTDVKAAVQIVHGMCEYKERYIPFMEFLSSHGYSCIIHDHRGHGKSIKSAEDLGYFYSSGWLGITDDILSVNEFITDLFPDSPVFLFGHSMGSLAARCFIKRHSTLADGLILCGSPSRNPAAGAGKMLARLIAAVKGERHRPESIRKIAFDGFNRNFSEEGPNSWLSTDRKNVEDYNSDPLCSFTFTANGFIALFNLMQDCYRLSDWKITEHDIPVMFIAGMDDPCIVSYKSYRKAADYMRAAGYTDVKSHIYNGMRHEILNETGKKLVWDDVLKALDRWALRISPAKEGQEAL